MYRKRRGRRGRFPKPVRLGIALSYKGFQPIDVPLEYDPVYLEHAELEALRLSDVEELSQEEIGEKMGVSRGTIWRLLQSARKKVAKALIEGRPIHFYS